MKTRTFALLLVLAGTLVTLTTLAGCASVPLKQRASATHQTVHAALVAIDDLERQLCAPAPTQPNHCTAPAAATIGLTDAKHQELSRQLVVAYRADAKLSTALITWRAGDPPPADLPTILRDAQETLAAVKPLTGSDGSRLVTRVQTWLDRLVALQAVFAH